MSELKGDLATLQQQVLEQPTKHQRGSDSEMQSQSVTIPGNLAIPSLPPTLKQDNDPDVPFWTKQEWDTFVEREKLGNKTPYGTHSSQTKKEL